MIPEPFDLKRLLFMSEWFYSKPITCSKGSKVPFAETDQKCIQFRITLHVLHVLGGLQSPKRFRPVRAGFYCS